MTRHGHRLFIALLVLSLLVPTGFQLWQLWHHTATTKDTPVFRLPVTGVDPRDPVRGRYATLQIDWPMPPEATGKCVTQPEKCGLCLHKDVQDKVATTYHSVADALPQTCFLFFPHVTKSGDSLFASREDNWNDRNFRVYLDESVADDVDHALRTGKIPFSADIVFPPKGPPVVKALYMDGKPYRDYLRSR